MTYGKMRTHAGIRYGFIKPALGVLTINHLSTVYKKLRAEEERGVVNGYCLRRLATRCMRGRPNAPSPKI